MKLRAALEYNEKGCLLWSLDCPGAFSRGRTREEAADKLPGDVRSFRRWAGLPQADWGGVLVAEEKKSALHIEDADSDMIFLSECVSMSAAEYAEAAALVLASARDFAALYRSVPDKDASLGQARGTFYGAYPDSARKMYEHTNAVTAYYVGELGVEARNDPDFELNRALALAKLEKKPGFLTAPPVKGSYDEEWSLRKVLRRFLWHDRLHARALYRRAFARWGAQIADPFGFATGKEGN